MQAGLVALVAQVDLERFELATESFERVRVELGVAGFFENEIPLRGGAGRVDWRLCGLISEQLAAGRLSGRLGEALLIPAERRFRADRVTCAFS